MHRWSGDIEGRSALVDILIWTISTSRYDGDSAWFRRNPRLDPGLPTMLLRVDELVEALAASKANIEDVSIAPLPRLLPRRVLATC